MNTSRNTGYPRNDRQLTLHGLAITAFLVLLLGMSGSEVSQYGNDDSTMRSLSSLPFPRHEATKDEGDVLSEYPEYLRFVLAIGKDVDPSTSSKLAKTYEQLRKRDPRGAARFLRGLRFEMVQKLEFSGANLATVNTSSPEMRNWVRRYISAWYREADEYLFRSVAFRSRRE